jgi:hypothetical protein
MKFTMLYLLQEEIIISFIFSDILHILAHFSPHYKKSSKKLL